jgi:DNA helicase-2/ATP-dependent DNA helicase PcrA
MNDTGLNEAQLDAVQRGDGYALVLAGAGSGKTRVIVERIAHLIGERGVNPREILALTFTNKAAGEMRDRAARRLGRDRLDAWAGTFHSFGLWVLRRDIDKLGRGKSFTIFDDTDQLALMKQLVKALPSNLVQVTPREALQWISRFKQDLAEPSKDDLEEEADETYAALWDRYHAALTRHEAVDFDDLLVLPAKLLGDDAVRSRYAERFRFVMIDEYQDTNRAQYVVAKHLSDVHGNLFVVGDEDQSIYSWRGADIRNILEFERDYPGANTFRLETNYRSTSDILDAANAVVAHNKKRLGKTLRSALGKGAPIKYHEAENGDEEARYVVDTIGARTSDGSRAAVLYRTNGQARVIEEALRRKGARYVVIGGQKFYERKEVRDLLAFLRAAANASDDVAMRRITNVPPRGLGSAATARFDSRAKDQDVSLSQIIREADLDDELTSRGRQGVTALVDLLDTVAADRFTLGVADLVEMVIERTQYDDYVRKSDEKDFRTGLEVIEEFRSACTAFDDREGPGGLEVFLQELALMTDIDAAKTGPAPVTLLTCHSAKGLEFDHVFLIGLEEGLLPHANSLDDDDGVEEERRLCYVAMTRAQTSLTLSSARERMLFGRTQDAERSRFFDEIPPALMGGGRTAAAEKPAKSAPRPSADTSEIKMGVRVHHAKFGEGVIMYTSGSGKKLKARIKFNTGPTRNIMVSHAPLEVVRRKR